MNSDTLIAGLLRPDAYRHPTHGIRLVETHCAWVLLTGEFAYKVKKPVDFGFLDFSTLEKRHFFCAEEIRLNRRFAPQIYLEVTGIGGTPQYPVVGGDGPPFEYAVRMRQFDADGLLSRLAAAGRLRQEHIDQLIETVAAFHRSAAAAAPDSDFGRPDRIHHWVSENFDHIRPSLRDTRDITRLERLRQWSDNERARLDAVLCRRRSEGFIRECHGDLHLGNITLIDARATPFDCIEFNPELRWIDVMSEVAFLSMDLDDRGYAAFAARFLNGYLQSGGDYAGLDVLRYYQVYRALVRAKVAILRSGQAAADSDARRRVAAEYDQYMRLAEQYIAPAPPVLCITHGLSGSGKSTLARALCERSGMIRIRSDVERKRMAGLAATDRSHSDTGAGLYTRGQTGLTYQRLADLARLTLRAGYSVVADATFLDRNQRGAFAALARELRVAFIILHCEASDSELQRRISAREAGGQDASEADLEVLRAQRLASDPLTAQEMAYTVNIDTERLDLGEVEASIARLARGQT
jgi:aminoglycoside phosphotransferase family enzyme/predicted kinase